MTSGTPRDSRAAIAFVFGLVGGIFICLGNLLFFPIGGYYGGPFGTTGFLLSVASGALVILAAAMAFWRPAQGLPWGVTEVVFGSLSVLTYGGFLVGLALAVAGGAIAIVVGATAPTPHAPLETARACLGCGRLFSREFAFCPHCGRAVPPEPGRGGA